ncbi:MAG TPA: hypothetical protein DGZ24_01545 [Rhodospirillaceae bacterium]|nr:hypothetical protein [Candidatus Neomarinimicrobiota bacterium]HCX13983.1 hypothetical protein [Rhodospirillaceae bacterium]
MFAWFDIIKIILGGKSANRLNLRRPSLKSQRRAVSPSNKKRAKLVKEALSVYRSRRSEIRGLLDKIFKDMRDKPPKMDGEHDKLVRLLALRRADVGLREMMSHDLRQYLVLSGIRGLLEDNPASRVPTKSSVTSGKSKSGRRKIPRR